MNTTFSPEGKPFGKSSFTFWDTFVSTKLLTLLPLTVSMEI